MSYLGRTSLDGCGCGCKGSGACKPKPLALAGAIAGTAPTLPGIAGAPKGVDPVLYLRAQLNRFTAAGGAPYQFQYAAQPLPLVAGPVDADTATRALWVLNMRAGYASLAAPNDATKQLLATYASAWSDPVGYITAHLPTVTDVVRLFADAQKLPGAKLPGIVSIPIVGDVSSTVALVGAGVLAAAIFLRRRRRR